MKEKFKQDVLEGLSAAKKRLSSKYFYDEKGDELFVQIMNMPEYYLTDAEMEIFTEKTDELIRELKLDPATPFEIIELGAGDGTKTIQLLRRLLEKEFDFHYHPVDISQNALDGLEEMLKRELPELKVVKQQGDYFTVLSGFKMSSSLKIVLFLGSTLGNMLDDKAANFISNLSHNLNSGDRLLLGLDMIKPRDIVLPAYNDAQGITKAFNLNILERINRELGANFQIDQFEHIPSYTEEEGIARSHLKSKVDQEVYIESLNKTFHFDKGETIHTEISRKYSEKLLQQLISDTDFTITGKVSDRKNYFSDYILKKTSSIIDVRGNKV
ncbi:MAG: L-histidine N(alpha)-methyltransferase [Crocinitomicaceae bacterium]